jgi:ABC-type transport system involved in multi-copper enzyme maturation permease subunit
MRQALVIARRELAEKRFIFVAAVAFAVLPFLIALIPGARSTAGSRDVIVVAAGLLCIGFTLAVALALGANVIGRDLAENRLSFYFARPVGAASIWFGKVAAAIALIAASFVIILLPARLTGGVKWTGAWGANANMFALAVLGVAIAFFFFGHTLGSFLRSRSAWIAVDFVAFVAAVIAGYLIINAMLDADANRSATLLIIVIGSGVAVALVGGGAWQLSRGRTDRKRSHLALSRFIWIVVGSTLAIAAAYTGWITSATPNDITKLIVAVPRPGSWVILGGETRGRLDYKSVFVYNLDSGAYTRIPVFWRADLTADGKKLVFARANRRLGTVEIFERPVERNDDQSTGLTLHPFTDYVVSANGDRIASVGQGLLNVYDVPQRSSLASVRLPDDFGIGIAMYFDSPGSLRILSMETATETLHLSELDVDRHALQRTGTFGRCSSRRSFISGNEDGSRLLVRDASQRLVVIDGRTAAVQATIDVAAWRDATFLRDGAIVVSRADGRQSAVDLFDVRGVFVRSIPLPAESTFSLHATRDGRMVLSAREGGRPWETLIVNPATAAIERVPATPLTDASWWRNDLRRGPIDLPQFFLEKGRVVRWNYAARKSEVIVPKG